MRKIILTAFLLFTFLAFYGCEGVTYLEREISNQSTTTITVEAILDDGSDVSLTIDPNETKLLFSTEQLGGSSVSINPSLGINSMIITNTNNDTLKKDYTIEMNWDILQVQTKKIFSEYNNIYTLVVEDTDF